MTAQLLLGTDTLIAVFPYDKETVAAVKTLPGAKWDKAARVWLIPIDHTEAAQQLAIRLGWWIQPEVAKINVATRTITAGLTISDDEKSIKLDFSWDPVKVRAVKQIPGVTWDKKTTAWVAPISSITEAVTWADQFALPISPETRQLVNQNQEKTAALIENSRRTEAPEIEVAGLPLLGYQRAGVAYASEARRCFIADDMGLGKTIQAIATLEHLPNTYPAVVVCPPTLVLNWAKEYEKWLPQRKVATVKNRKDFPEPGFDVLVVGYSNIKAWENQLRGYKAYVFDESHYLKSPDAQRTKAAIKISKSAPKDGVVLCLTGTPVTNRPAEYAPQLDILGKLADFGGKWGFYRRYCNPPEAPIWMADFTHKPLGEVAVGDKIIGWDGMNGGGRKLRESIVLAVMERTSPIVKVTLKSGRKIRCTPDHLWISGKGRRWDYKSGNVKTDCFVEPKVGKSLAFAVTPISACPDHLVGTASWIGGIYDGEGTNQRIAQSKSFNPEIYERICRSLDELGFDFSEQQDGMGVNFLGGKSEFARFLAWCKPTKSQWLKDRVLGPNFFRDDIVSVENDGVGEVISLTTSTGNYFAWGYASKNCAAFRDRFGQWNISGHSNLDELNDRLRGNCYIRRTKEQVLEELPPVRHSKVIVDGTAGGMKEYEKAEADIVAYLVERAKQIAADIGESPKSAAVRAKMRAESNEHLVKIGVLRKLAARAKMPAVAEWVDSHLEAGKKVVIAAHHREIVDELASRYGNLKIQGGMDVTEVEAHKSRFQEGTVDEAPTIVLSIQAAKTGHTLTAAQDVLFVELPWTPSDVDQTYSRCHRLGQRGSVTATYLLCAGTIDEQIYNIIERKRSVVTAATEGEFVGKGAGHEVFDRYLKLSFDG
jgi:hypothetical protein